MPQANAKKPPASRAGKMIGSRMHLTICQGDPPAIRATHSKEGGIFSI
jgi:hypothetical protein